MIDILIDTAFHYFTKQTIAIFIIDNILNIWIIPSLRVGNDTFKLFLIAVFMHLADIFKSINTVIPIATMESLMNKHVTSFFVRPLKNYDFNFQKLNAQRSKINRLQKNLVNKLEQFTYRISFDLTVTVRIISQVLILVYYIPAAFAFAIVMIHIIIIAVREADAKRFSNDEIVSRMSYLTARNSFEILNNPSQYSYHIDQLKKVHYDMSIAWGEYRVKLITQRIGIDGAVLGFIAYCMLYLLISGNDNPLVIVNCINFLKNIQRISDMSKFYIGLYIDFMNLRNIRSKLKTKKISQINGFQSIMIPKQSIKFDGGFLEVDELKLPNVGSVVLTGDSGQGKSTFLDSFSGCLPSDLNGIFQISDDLKQLPTASIRNITTICNHTIEEVRNVSPFNLITKFGELNVDVKECVYLAALPDTFDIHNRSTGETSKGEFQRICVAEIMARIITDSTKKIIILDEITDGLDNTTAILMVDRIIKRFGKTHLILIVTHNSVVQETIKFNHRIHAEKLTITQLY